MRTLLISSLVVGVMAAGTSVAQEPGAEPGTEPGIERELPRTDGIDDGMGTQPIPRNDVAPVPEPFDATATDDQTRGESSYVVQKGDTLSAIAESKLGNPAEWKKIAKLNGIDDPKKLEIGTRLKVPKRENGSERSLF